MFELGVKNLRSLVNVPNVRLCPITVLVGKNSSGKSTFLRLLPLLKQTFETKTSEPLLWYGNYVDFGDFEESKTRNSQCEEIEISFRVPINTNDFRKSYRHLSYQVYRDNNNLDTKISIAFSKKRVSQIQIDFNDQKVFMKLEEKDKISSFIINGINFTDKSIKWYPEVYGMLPRIEYMDGSDNKFLSHFPIEYEENFANQLTDYLMKYAHGSTKKENVANALGLIQLGSKQNIIDSILSNNKFPDSLKKNIINSNSADNCFENINNLVVAMFFSEFLLNCNNQIGSIAKSVRYSKPLRNTVDRYYRIQGLSITEIDPSGDNLPMVLYNLSHAEKESFENWTSETLGCIFTTVEREGHISLLLHENTTNEKYNLADVGFGYSQILPILLSIWKATVVESKYQHKLLGNAFRFYEVIEQPELHLHPAFQARLIDIFAEIAKKSNTGNDINIIFETHSETIINRLGYLISKKQLSKDNVNILFFNKNKNGETEVKSVEFSDSGVLQDWPIGFFAPDRL